MRLAAWVLGAGLTLAGMVPAGPAGVMGDWATPGGSVVRVAACGGEICLTVVKVDPHAPVAVDAQNPDKGLRSRPLCGLRIGSGFKAEGENAASGGRLYDPKSGRTYSGRFERRGETLQLRGYVGISLFGRSETWKRSGEPGDCR